MVERRCKSVERKSAGRWINCVLWLLWWSKRMCNVRFPIRSLTVTNRIKIEERSAIFDLLKVEGWENLEMRFWTDDYGLSPLGAYTKALFLCFTCLRGTWENLENNATPQAGPDPKRQPLLIHTLLDTRIQTCETVNEELIFPVSQSYLVRFCM